MSVTIGSIASGPLVPGGSTHLLLAPPIVEAAGPPVMTSPDRV